MFTASTCVNQSCHIQEISITFNIIYKIKSAFTIDLGFDIIRFVVIRFLRHIFIHTQKKKKTLNDTIYLQ